MSVSMLMCIKSLFARDKYAFWRSKITVEEKKLASMDAWELAAVITEAKGNRIDMVQERIVAEHMLNLRLAEIQAKASWGSGILGFVGAIIGSALSVSLTIALQNPKEVPSVPERNSEKQAVAAPVQKQREPIAQPSKSVPSNPVVEVTPGAHSAVNEPRHGTDTKQPNAAAKP